VAINDSQPQPLDPDVKDALLAYLEAVAVSEPIQAQLWQEAGITLTQLSVLRQLRQGPHPAGRLGHAVGLSPTSITRVLDRLEERGLVSRRRDREDRRCVDIHLEPKGQQLLGGVRVIRGSDLHRAVESMTSQERGQLTTALRRLIQRAQATSNLPAHP
jgi:MarR family 2-MHQ and catechol resistance regulon transcriptional repressor